MPWRSRWASGGAEASDRSFRIGRCANQALRFADHAVRNFKPRVVALTGQRPSFAAVASQRVLRASRKSGERPSSLPPRADGWREGQGKVALTHVLGQAVSALPTHGNPRFPTLPTQPNLLQNRCFPTYPAPARFQACWPPACYLSARDQVRSFTQFYSS